MKKAYVFLADGFEEIEAVTPIDIMKRAGIHVVTVGVLGKRVNGAHDIVIEADIYGDEFHLPDDADLVFLPGGGQGTQNLLNSSIVSAVLKDAQDRNTIVAAICAAPLVLQKAGMLTNKNITAFPAVQHELMGCNFTGAPVEEDGNIITARSAGVALEFAYALLCRLVGVDKAKATIESVYPSNMDFMCN